MLKEILMFSKENEKNLNKLINNEEINIEENIDFFKLISEKARQIDDMEIQNLTEEENTKIYVICYYRDIYDDYMSSLRRNGAQK